jgi:hypothetical protein
VLQLTRLVEGVNRNFDETRLTSAVFLHVAKAFDTVWVKRYPLQAYYRKFPVLSGENHILISSLPDVLPFSHTHMS